MKGVVVLSLPSPSVHDSPWDTVAIYLSTSMIVDAQAALGSLHSLAVVEGILTQTRGPNAGRDYRSDGVVDGIKVCGVTGG